MTGHARRLERPDKWYLGAGDGLLYAPPFPQWLDVPGFWDEAQLFQYAIHPLFAVTFLSKGQPRSPRPADRSWTPDQLTVRYHLRGIDAVERREAPGSHRLRSSWTLANRGTRGAELDVVVWTMCPGAEVPADSVRVNDGGLRLDRRIEDRHGHRTTVTVVLRIEPAASSWAAYCSESAVEHPRFELTPFADRWSGDGLANEAHLKGLSAAGVVYVALHRRVLIPARESVNFAAEIEFILKGIRERPPAGEPNWESFLDGVPSLESSDPFVTYAWYNRWYGLRLNRVGVFGHYRYPSVCEGIGYFHQPIGYSAPCHAREVRWAHDRRWAHGVLRTFLEHQRPDGALHGRIYVDHLQNTDFYHADWGGAALAVLTVHPDAAVAAELYDGLARYAHWLLATRDREGSGMIDIVNQFECGQEYMSRYLAVDENADVYGWADRIRLKGIDVTVYAYRLFRALERLAHEVGRADDGARWREAAERTGNAIVQAMWDPELGMFSDVDPRSGERTRVKAAVCFYPYLTDLVGEVHVAGLEAHLFNPAEFWTPYPVPSSACDDPQFNPDGEWKGKRHHCPWNGRVWPMTNSHVADALAHVVRTHRRNWAPRFAHFLSRFLQMMTFGGRADHPNAFEHYHPFHGRPSLYRGIDDYQHCWINDLLVSHVFGFQPCVGDRFVVDPIPCGLERAKLSGLVYRGRRVELELEGDQVHVAIDRRLVNHSTIGSPFEVAI